MKRFLIGFLISVNILGVGCSKSELQNQDVGVQQQKEDEKREEFLNNAEAYMQELVDESNKKTVEDKLTLVREDNIITYTVPTSDDLTLTELINSYPQGDKSMKESAKETRQKTVDNLSKHYDQIVEKYGCDYEFYLRSSKSYGGETFLVIRYGEEGYEIEYDLFEQFGY